MIKRVANFVYGYFAVLVIVGVFIWSVGMILSYRAKENPPNAIVLRLGHWQLEASVRDAFYELAADYRREVNPNVYIVQDAIPESIYGQWVSTQLIGGTAPDMMEIGLGLPYSTWISFQNRYFLPLSQEVQKPNPYNADNEFAGVSQRLTYKDGMRSGYVEELQEYMSFALSQFSARVFYNKDLLRKLTGTDRAPRDYREFLAACAKIQSQRDAQGKPYIPIAGSKYHYQMWESAMFNMLTYGALRKLDFNHDGSASSDETYAGIHSGRIDFNFPPLVAKFQMIREVTQYFPSGYTGLTRDEAVFLFAQDRAVFMSTGTWDAGSLQELARGKFDLGVMDFPMPLPTDPEYGPFIEGPRYDQIGTGFNFGITRTCQHPEIALDFLRYLTSKKGNTKLNRIINWIPAIKNTQVPPMLAGFAPNYEGIYSAGSFWLGSETYLKWMQFLSLYQVNQIDYPDFAREFSAAYLAAAPRDFLDVQRDWQRSAQTNEQILAGLRARALTADPAQAPVFWRKYLDRTLRRQPWPQMSQVREVQMCNAPPDPQTPGPYEYTPQALEHIRQNLAGQPGGPAASQP